MCDRACGLREGTCVYTVRLMEQDRGEVDYRGDYNFFFNTLSSAAPPACMRLYARMLFTCVFEYSLHDLALLQQDSWISHPSLA